MNVKLLTCLISAGICTTNIVPVNKKFYTSDNIKTIIQRSEVGLMRSAFCSLYCYDVIFPKDEKSTVFQKCNAFLSSRDAKQFIPKILQKKGVKLTVHEECKTLEELKELTKVKDVKDKNYKRMFVIDLDETCCKSADPRYCHQTLLLWAYLYKDKHSSEVKIKNKNSYGLLNIMMTELLVSSIKQFVQNNKMPERLNMIEKLIFRKFLSENNIHRDSDDIEILTKIAKVFLDDKNILSCPEELGKGYVTDAGFVSAYLEKIIENGCDGENTNVKKEDECILKSVRDVVFSADFFRYIFHLANIQNNILRPDMREYIKELQNEKCNRVTFCSNMHRNFLHNRCMQFLSEGLLRYSDNTVLTSMIERFSDKTEFYANVLHCSGDKTKCISAFADFLSQDESGSELIMTIIDDDLRKLDEFKSGILRYDSKVNEVEMIRFTYIKTLTPIQSITKSVYFAIFDEDGVEEFINLVENMNLRGDVAVMKSENERVDYYNGIINGLKEDGSAVMSDADKTLVYDVMSSFWGDIALKSLLRILPYNVDDLNTDDY